MARLSALSYKAKDANLLVIEDLNFDKPNTKTYLSMLSNLNMNNDRTLIVTTDNNTNVYLSSRNIQKTTVMPASEINTYQIMKAKKLIVCEGALNIIEQTLNNN